RFKASSFPRFSEFIEEKTLRYSKEGMESMDQFRFSRTKILKLCQLRSISTGMLPSKRLTTEVQVSELGEAANG
ncbi:hypothetical protein D5086_005389, partial [Populus alba]